MSCFRKHIVLIQTATLIIISHLFLLVRMTRNLLLINRHILHLLLLIHFWLRLLLNILWWLLHCRSILYERSFLDVIMSWLCLLKLARLISFLIGGFMLIHLVLLLILNSITCSLLFLYLSVLIYLCLVLRLFTLFLLWACFFCMCLLMSFLLRFMSCVLFCIQKFILYFHQFRNIPVFEFSVFWLLIIHRV